MLKINKTSALLCVAGIALTSCLALTACNTADNRAPEEKIPTSYVAVDVNPSVEFVLDQHDSVLSMTGVNTDARVMLFNESGFIGEKMDAAYSRMLRLADESDLIDDGSNIVGISVYSVDPAVAQRVYADMDAAAQALNESDDIDVANVRADDLALSCELDELKADPSSAATFDDMTLEKFRLVKRVSQYEDIDVSAAAALDDGALIASVRDVQADSDTKLGKLYDRAVTEAKFVLESATQSAKDALYPLYFADKTFDDGIWNWLTNSRHWAYANIYVAIHSLYINLDHYYNSLSEYLRDPVFTLDDLKEALANVSQTFKDAVTNIFGQKQQDENGEITAEVINENLSGAYRNLPAAEREEFRQQYIALKKTALEDPPVEEHVSKDGILQEIADAFNAIKNDITNSEFLNKVKDWMDALGLTEMFDSIQTSFKEAFEGVDFANIFDVKRAIGRVKEASDWAYGKMELTDNDLDAVSALEGNISQELADAKASFQETVADAKKAAARWLEDAKNAFGANN